MQDSTACHDASHVIAHIILNIVCVCVLRIVTVQLCRAPGS